MMALVRTLTIADNRLSLFAVGFSRIGYLKQAKKGTILPETLGWIYIQDEHAATKSILLNLVPLITYS